MANEFVGKKLNVESRKGVHQETIIKQLSTKGIVRTEEGNEYNIADLRKKGRGIFVTAAGGAKPKATVVAATENTRKPTERPAAAAVTAEELEGKKVNGVAVSKILKRAGVVKLEDGTELALADISRKGRGYITEGAAPAPAKATVGGAKPKAAKADADEGTTVTNAELRGQSAKIRIDGKLHTIIATIKGEKFKTDKEFKGETADIRNIGGKYVLETAEYKAAQAPAVVETAKPASRAPAPIKRSELRDKNIAVGDDVHVMVKTLKTDEVITNKGFRFSVADVARKGRGYIYTGEIVAKKGGAVPRPRTAPEPVSQIVSVAAFDNDTAADISDLLEKAVRTALADAYDVDVASTFVQYEDQIATFSFQIAVADASPAFVKGKVEAYRSRAEAQAVAEPAPVSAKVNDADFNKAELVDELDEDEEDEEEETVQADPDALDVDEDDEDEEDTAFPDEQDEDDLDEEEENDTDFPDEAPGEIAFPEDTSELVEQGTARLASFFPNKSMTGFVSRWYASQEAFDAIGYDLEPGMTVVIDDVDYVLVGLKADGVVMLVNTQSGAARPKIDLDALQIIVAENERNA